jgi:hypothetical protein
MDPSDEQQFRHSSRELGKCMSILQKEFMAELDDEALVRDLIVHWYHIMLTQRPDPTMGLLAVLSQLQKEEE